MHLVSLIRASGVAIIFFFPPSVPPLSSYFFPSSSWWPSCFGKRTWQWKIFLTIGREHLFRSFSWLSFTFHWVGMVVPLAPRNFKWFVRFRFSKLKRLKKELAKMFLSFWSQGARRDISWVCSAQFNDGWRRLIERNERDWKWSFRICSISDLICRRKTNNPYSICVKFIIGNKKIMNGFS